MGKRNLFIMLMFLLAIVCRSVSASADDRYMITAKETDTITGNDNVKYLIIKNNRYEFDPQKQGIIIGNRLLPTQKYQKKDAEKQDTLHIIEATVLKYENDTLNFQFTTKDISPITISSGDIILATIDKLESENLSISVAGKNIKQGAIVLISSPNGLCTLIKVRNTNTSINTEEKKSDNAFLIILISLLIVCIIGFAIWWYLKKRNQKVLKISKPKSEDINKKYGFTYCTVTLTWDDADLTEKDIINFLKEEYYNKKLQDKASEIDQIINELKNKRDNHNNSDDNNKFLDVLLLESKSEDKDYYVLKIKDNKDNNDKTVKFAKLPEALKALKHKEPAPVASTEYTDDEIEDTHRAAALKADVSKTDKTDEVDKDAEFARELKANFETNNVPEKKAEEWGEYLDNLIDSHKLLTKEKAKLNEEIEEKNSQIGELKKNLRKAEDSVQKEVENARKEDKETINKKNKEIEKLTDEKEKLENDKTKLNKDVTQLKADLKDKKGEVDKLNGDMQRFTNKLGTFPTVESVARNLVEFLDAVTALENHSKLSLASLVKGNKGKAAKILADAVDVYAREVSGLESKRKEITLQASLLAKTSFDIKDGELDKILASQKVESALVDDFKYYIYQNLGTLMGEAVRLADVLKHLDHGGNADLNDVKEYAGLPKKIIGLIEKLGMKVEYAELYTSSDDYSEIDVEDFSSEPDVKDGFITAVKQMAVNYGTSSNKTKVVVKG